MKRLEFNLALPKRWREERVWEDGFPWYASRLQEGKRLLIVLDGGPPKAYDKTGKAWKKRKDLLKSFKKYSAAECVLDGVWDEEEECFSIFDWIPLEDFLSGGGYEFMPRQVILEEVEGVLGEFVEIVSQIRIDSEEKFERIRKRATRQGWKGIILRRDVPYEGKRTKEILLVSGRRMKPCSTSTNR